MEDPLQYTKDEIIKNLILTETHLKQATTGVDEQFCAECLDKHFYNLEGLGEEGISFTQDKKEIDIFSEVATTSKKFRGQDYKKYGVKYAQKIRNIRKSLTDYCPTCITNSPKHLNNPSTFHNQLNKRTKNNMVKFAELGTINLGQFVAEGVKYFLEVRPQTATMENVITIGGGGVLQAIALFTKMPKQLKTGILVAGSNLFAHGVVKLVKGVPAPVVAVRAAAAPAQGTTGFTGKPNDRVFGGRVTASGIPTQYARAGILAGAQAYEAPEHADLIRVD